MSEPCLPACRSFIYPRLNETARPSAAASIGIPSTYSRATQSLAATRTRPATSHAAPHQQDLKTVMKRARQVPLERQGGDAEHLFHVHKIYRNVDVQRLVVDFTNMTCPLSAG